MHGVIRAKPSGHFEPEANVVIRKSFELTLDPWTVNGAAPTA